MTGAQAVEEVSLFRLGGGGRHILVINHFHEFQPTSAMATRTHDVIISSERARCSDSKRGTRTFETSKRIHKHRCSRGVQVFVLLLLVQKLTRFFILLFVLLNILCERKKERVDDFAHNKMPKSCSFEGFGFTFSKKCQFKAFCVLLCLLFKFLIVLTSVAQTKLELTTKYS